jgi:hypothetical protein
MAEETCLGCGIEKNEWGDSRGYLDGDQVFCCQGCAEDMACTCYWSRSRKQMTRKLIAR